MRPRVARSLNLSFLRQQAVCSFIEPKFFAELARIASELFLYSRLDFYFGDSLSAFHSQPRAKPFRGVGERDGADVAVVVMYNQELHAWRPWYATLLFEELAREAEVQAGTPFGGTATPHNEYEAQAPL
jgi:hypothetical protein